MSVMNKHPECPKCGSQNTETHLEDYATILAECFNCDHKWEVSGWD